MDRPDFNSAAELYVESNFAQHGDVELARAEAMEWWDIFRQLTEEDYAYRRSLLGGFDISDEALADLEDL